MRAIKKRSIVIGDHRTSISLEDAFWDGLKEIASRRRKPLNAIVAEVDSGRKQNQGLSSCLREFVLAEMSATHAVE